MTLPSRSPATSAAVTNSSSRRASSLPRTTRASPVQPSTDRITVMAKYRCTGVHVSGIAALSASHSGMVGNERNNSMMRCTTVSVRPP